MRRIEVAAAVIFRADGKFLLAQRPPGKVYAGYWEFPGGKIEDGESAENALRRELREELGIEVRRAYPWITRDYDYAHAAVRLRFFRVADWCGEPQGKEAQQFAWESARAPAVAPILPANGPVLRSLALPEVYGISNAAGLGRDEFLRRLERALAAGLGLVQIREKGLPGDELRALAAAAVRLVRRHGARVLVNDDADLARAVGADGVHLPSARLMGLRSRPDFDLVGASCHDALELRRAVEAGADFVVLGPVKPTLSHPGGATLGWERFAAMIADYPLPVYALGGMKPADREPAWRAGAHGIAMMRGAWA